MVDTSWILGIVMTGCFSVGVIGITIKLLSCVFSKEDKREKERKE